MWPRPFSRPTDKVGPCLSDGPGCKRAYDHARFLKDGEPARERATVTLDGTIVERAGVVCRRGLRRRMWGETRAKIEFIAFM